MAVKEQRSKSPETTSKNPSKTNTRSSKKKTLAVSFPIVGIGASAGGLEALEGFIGSMPSDSSIALVIIQHLAPQHKSIMGSILQKHTSMKVIEIEDGMKIEPNCVYLNPPDKQVILINRILQLTEPVKTQGINLPIDAFFRSLSEDLGEKAICIVLSGTGSDGTLGLKAVKGEGGMAMVQEEKQAKYAGMPRSAIDTGLVDYILPVEKMPGELIKYVKHPYIKDMEKIAIPEEKFSNYFQKIFAIIRTKTGHDFSNYKQTTIRRRVERRLALHQIERMEDYIKYIQNTPAEAEILYKEMLIGVTNFFRDTDAFNLIEKQVVPAIIAKKSIDVPIRVWVPGCSTGEEAYSIAILFAEAMERLKTHAAIQIFASDLDADSVNYARLGVYPESIAAYVSPERLKHFFIKDDNTFKVKKRIREMVVFAVHNLIKDPPFSRLDLISCRNLLIYMDTVLQKQLLPLFHYALLPQGVLFLGSSESIGEFATLFTPVNNKWKIFARKEGFMTQRGNMAMPYPAVQAREAPGTKPPGAVDLKRLGEKFALDNYTSPCVLINEKYEILYMIGPVDRYLMFAPGEPTYNLMHITREGLRYKLTTMIQKATKQKKAITMEGFKVRQNGGFRTIDVIVRPLLETAYPEGLIMVVFQERTIRETQEQGTKAPRLEGDADPRVAALEQDLQSTKEYLQTTIEELETSNEELKSTNEELQSTNEELQSTNEELETSKEELQSTNEELTTVNAELSNKVEELSRVSNDINNLLASTDIGTIFLDNNLCIKRFTPAAAKYFNLIPTDLGRPISDITSNLTYEDFYRDAKEVLDTLSRKALEVQTKEGVWYAVRIIPYRTIENIIDGVVVTFIDIAGIKQTEALQSLFEKMKLEVQRREDAEDKIGIQTVYLDMVQIHACDMNDQIILWHKGAERLYGYDASEAVGKISRILLKTEFSVPFDTIKKQLLNTGQWEGELTRTTRDGLRIKVACLWVLHRDAKGRPLSIIKSEGEKGR